jgi:Bacterial Ig-like domain
MPKQPLQPQSPRRLLHFHLLRQFWIVSLLVLFVVNLTAIGYVILYGARQLNDTEIRATTISQITTQDPVVVQFNTPMLQSSVVNALQITPVQPYQVLWTDDSQQLTIIPDTSWQHTTTYTVRISTSAQSRTGRYLKQEWSAQIQAQRVVQIRQVLPTPNQVDVTRDSMIVVRFGQQMVTQAVVGSALDQSPLQIFPLISGVSTWLDSRTLAFQPSTLAPNQEYTVTVPAQLMDVAGTPLQRSYTWRFRTMATRIERSFPPTESQEVSLQQSLVFTMTGQINEEQLRQSIQITPTIETQLTSMPLSSNQTRVDITAPLGWQSDTQYTVTLGGGESDLAPFGMTFKTAPALRLVARTPGEGEAVGSDREVRFIFNTLLDTSTITDAITISPPPIQPARITTTGRDIRITANWEVQVNPVIQISSALRNTNGISLTNPITSELRIDPRRALATLPGVPGSIYDASTTSTFQLQIIPNRTAILRVYDVPIATLVRMLDMDVSTFLEIDPGRYNLPLLAQQELQSTDNRSQISIDIMQGITATPISRIWLVQLVSANGSQDVRLVRTQPATIHAVSLPQQVAIGLQEQQVPQPDRPILVFQSGQLINQGQTDARGIWQTTTYNTNQDLVVIDPQQPTDAHTLRILPVVENDELQLLVDRKSVVRGDQLTVLLSRQSSERMHEAVINVRNSTGELMSEQPVVFDVDIRMTSTRIRLPKQLIPGIYTVEIMLDGRMARQHILVHREITSAATVTHEQQNDMHVVTLHDQYGQVLTNQSAYWIIDAQYGQMVSNNRGEIVIPASQHPTTVLFETPSGSIIHHIAPQTTSQRLTFAHANWFDIDQVATITMQLVDSMAAVDNRVVQVVVQNTSGRIVTRQRIVTDIDGIATTTLSLPRGQWTLTASTADIEASTTLWVGMSSDNNTFEPETDELVRDQIPRWRSNQSASTQLLIAQSLNQQFQVAWTQSNDMGLVTSDPISQTGTLHAVIGAVGQPYHRSEQQIINPGCPTEAQISAVTRDQLVTIRVGYVPNSSFLFNVYDVTGQQLIAESINMRSDENGMIEFQRPDNGATQIVQISLMAMTDECFLAVTQTIPVMRTQLLNLDAPAAVRIGDVIGVTLTIQDYQPNQYSRFFVSPEGLQIVDTLPQFAVTSNQQGVATITWNYRVQDEKAQLTVESSQSPPLRWQPRVIMPPVTYTNDGFVLEGTTSLEQGANPPTLLDIITTKQQLQQALSKTPYDPSNPSQIAHRIWHTASPTDQLILIQQLMQLKLANGAWGWVGSQVADPLITADVVIALTQAQQSTQSHQSALRYLQQQVQSPQLSPSIRAMVAYALSLNQQPPITELIALGQSPQLLGNEGLAALLLSMPAEYAYTIPPIVAELLQRARSAPRGLWWAPDTATASLHSQENVNALIYQALSYRNLATNERMQLGTQLISIRGVNGWADSISNGRIWSQHRVLLATITANTAISIVSDTGQIVHMGMMSPAQPIAVDGLLQTDDDVLVGIARPRNTPTPTGEAVIWLQMYRDDGTYIPSKAVITRGEEITVRVRMAFFSSIPHVSIIDPQSTLSTIMTPPVNTSGISVQSESHLITLHTSVDSARIVQYNYRIRLTHVGQSILEPIEIRDGSGTLHARSNTVMVYVVAP